MDSKNELCGKDSLFKKVRRWINAIFWKNSYLANTSINKINLIVTPDVELKRRNWAMLE